jgi:PAS domain S-box-containing protein
MPDSHACDPFAPFAGDGEMATRMRQYDWQASALGPLDGWPQLLEQAMRMLMASPSAMVLGWGPELHLFYNDACRPIFGQKHPSALGQPARLVWSEDAWNVLAEPVQSVMASGQGRYERHLQVLMQRSGYPEETYLNISFCPLVDDDGRVLGLLSSVVEDTAAFINTRRLSTLRDLAMELGQADTRVLLFEALARVLERNLFDLPFSLTYVFNEARAAWLACSTGVEPGHPAIPRSIDDGQPGLWPAERMLAGESTVILPLPAGFDPAPTGAWSLPPQQVALVPIKGQGSQRTIGFMVMGLSPYCLPDAGYLDFLQLVAAQAASTLAGAEAYEVERRRVEVLAEVARMKQLAAESMREVNERLVDEVRLRTAERDHLQSLFQQAPGFICVLNGPEHVFELVNEAYLQLVGERDLIGLPVREALPELEGQGMVELLDQVYRSGKSYVGRNSLVRLKRGADGRTYEVYQHFVLQPIFEMDGRVSGIFVEGSDITEQILAEQVVHRLNETLESKVAERTDALAEALRRLRSESEEREAAQEALRHSQKMEAVGQLTGGIAHDFNNLLTGIIGSLELMQRRIANGRLDGVERYVNAATASANRAAALTHRLLAFSRRQPLAARPVDANVLVLAMADLLQRSVGENVELEIITADELWPIFCDANQLENAILNLALNARDAMPHGGRLKIETCNAQLSTAAVPGRIEASAGDYICICISDTGTGMSPSVAERAFEPFFTTKPMGQGTGLGLSMVYGFARQSQGYTQIDSLVGRGTQVKLYLPRHDGDPASAPNPGPVLRHRVAGERVLVVEDEEPVRQLVVEALKELGCLTHEAADGPSGLRFLESGEPLDLLISDIGLPGLNGRLMADVGRMHRPELKVLFMTGYADEALTADSFLKPGMGLLTKPFSIEELSRRVLEILGGEGAAASGQAPDAGNGTVTGA